MGKIDTDVEKAVEKIVRGGTEDSFIDSLGVIYEIYDSLADSNKIIVPEDAVGWYKKNYGESVFTETKEYVERLRLRLRTELARKHSILETFRIYTALSFLKCKLIRVSKSSDNYKNVRIARAFTKVATCGEDLPYSLFEALKTMESIK